MKDFLSKVNVSRYIADHLVGQHHTISHRRLVGVVVMISGVGIYKLACMVDFTIIHFGGEVLGYAIHGMGLIPFAEKLE